MPRGISHGFSNPSADPARILPVVTPDACGCRKPYLQTLTCGFASVAEVRDDRQP
jgi:hypothetical protein